LNLHSPTPVGHMDVPDPNINPLPDPGDTPNLKRQRFIIYFYMLIFKSLDLLA